MKSKTELIRLKEELSFLKEGRNVLEEKRNILLEEVLKVVNRVDALREKLTAATVEAYLYLEKALMEAGKQQLTEETTRRKPRLELEVKETVFLGLVMPEVRFKLEENKKLVASEFLFPELARERFLEVLRLVLEISELEMRGWRLAEEIKKTAVRLNAIENYYIPEVKQRVKEIEETLEENERLFLSILKKIKSPA